MEEQRGTVMGYPIEVQAIRLTNIQLTTTNTIPTTIITANAHHHVAQSHQSNTTNNKDNRLQFIFFLIILPFCAFISMSAVFYSPSFQVDSVLVDPFNISASHITANWSITFSVTNHNFDSICFEGVKASIFYEEANMSSTMMENFIVNPWYMKYYKRSLQANIGVFSIYINSLTGDKMAADWSHGAVKFDVKLNAIARSEVTDDDSVLIKVSCEDMKIGFSSNMTRGTMLGGSQACKVRFTYVMNIILIVTGVLFLFIFVCLVFQFVKEQRRKRQTGQ